MRYQGFKILLCMFLWSSLSAHADTNAAASVDAPAFTKEITIDNQQGEGAYQVAENADAYDSLSFDLTKSSSAAPVTEPEASQVEQDSSTAPAPTPEPMVDSTSVEAQLEALVESRKRGEMSGDEYLAERNRIIYGE